MTPAAFFAILGLIGLAACAAVWLGERDTERQDRERVAQVGLYVVPDRGWHATNHEGGHHPEARETADGRYRPGCTCPWDCLRLDPRSDHPWQLAGEAITEADRLLRERSGR